MAYLTLKSLHLILLISWFAGLFYLPRIFVNLAMATDVVEKERLIGMSRRLIKFMTPLGVLAVAFGFWTWWEVYPLVSVWLHIKATLTLLLLAYNAHCFYILKTFQTNTNRHSHKWFRIYNEIPTILMFACVCLAVFKMP